MTCKVDGVTHLFHTDHASKYLFRSFHILKTYFPNHLVDFGLELSLPAHKNIKPKYI